MIVEKTQTKKKMAGNGTFLMLCWYRRQDQFKFYNVGARFQVNEFWVAKWRSK